MQKNISTRGASMAYTLFGKGIPVILIHGFGEDSQVWNTQVNCLEKSYKVITVDLPGVGKSTPLENSHTYLVDYADCIHDLLQKENIQACVLLGHSMGGYITLAFAEKYPEKLLAFGLIHSTAYADNEEKKKTRQKSIEFIEAKGSYTFLKTSIPNLFGVAYQQKQGKAVASFIEQAGKIRKETLIQFTKAMMIREDKTSVLKKSAVPILFVIGTEDIAAPMKDLEAQTSIPEQAIVTKLENVGHMSMMEAPEKLNDALVSFLGALKKNP